MRLRGERGMIWLAGFMFGVVAFVLVKMFSDVMVSVIVGLIVCFLVVVIGTIRKKRTPRGGAEK